MSNAQVTAVVCVAASDSWYGKIVRKLTRSSVNHAFVAYYSDVHEGWQALQTDERGLVEVPLESLKYRHIECYAFEGMNLLSALPKCRNLIGDSYDTLGIIGFLLKILVWRLVGRRILNPLHKKGELFCSEFVVMFLQRVEGMFEWMKVVDAAGVAPGGNEHVLGVASLRELLRTNTGVWKLECPFWEERGVE